MGKYKRGDKPKRTRGGPKSGGPSGKWIGNIFVYKVGKYTVETDCPEIIRAIRGLRTEGGVRRAMDKAMEELRAEGRTAKEN